jgi:hypothetical protein
MILFDSSYFSVISGRLEYANRLVYFGARAFQCSGLHWIDMPFHTVTIGEYCFQSCSSFVSIQFHTFLRSLTIEAGAFSRTSIGEFVTPDTLLQSEVTSIPLRSNLFESSRLSLLVIGRRVESIGASSFYRCSSLREVRFENKSLLKKIESRAFSESGLRDIILPSSVEYLGSRCFSNCSHLKAVGFASLSKLREVCNFAFFSPSLTSICLPASLSSIEGSSLVTMSSITIESGSDRLSVDSSFLYDFGHKRLIRYFGSDLIVHIPSGVEIIGESSFCESQIRRIHIPKSVKILDC